MTDKSSAARGAAGLAHRHAEAGPPKSGATRLLGSLRDALLAAGRETTDHADGPRATFAQSTARSPDPSTRAHQNERHPAMTEILDDTPVRARQLAGLGQIKSRMGLAADGSLSARPSEAAARIVLASARHLDATLPRPSRSA